MTSTVVFLHAHPDDEAIFTGGSMVQLAAQGYRVVLVLATRGESGLAAQAGADDLGTHRWAETEAAAAILGIHRVVSLGYGDSGMADEPTPAGSFVDASQSEAVARLAAVLDEEGATAIVTYDSFGIYGHPDHIKAHHVGLAAALHCGVETVYEATVDREYLHFVETHLVVEAGVPDRPAGLGLAATDLGLPSVLIDLELDVRAVLDRKRKAMAAHGSQIPASSSAMQLPAASFAAVYGFEWYTRAGPPGPLDALGIC